MSTTCSRLALCVFLMLLGGDEQAPSRQVDQEALAPLQAFVGPWRGVGQVRRGSNQGAWIEQADWAWKFDDNRATIHFAAPKSKQLREGVLAPTEKAGRYQLTATLADKRRLVYEGVQHDGRLTLEALPDSLGSAAATTPARITLRLTAQGKRMVMLLERKAGADGYARIAEIGYTRKGSRFGKGASYIECVVTGGLGVIPVNYEGKTYSVCCSGCRDLFNDDPQGVLEDYRQRQKAKAEDGEQR